MHPPSLFRFFLTSSYLSSLFVLGSLAPNQDFGTLKMNDNDWRSQEVPISTESLHLWVRADDLGPMQVAEGEARLVNDLHLLPLEERKGKEVVKWSLFLRHRERASIAIKVKESITSREGEPASSSSSLTEEPAADDEVWTVIEEKSLTFESQSMVKESIETKGNGEFLSNCMGIMESHLKAFALLSRLPKSIASI